MPTYRAELRIGVYGDSSWDAARQSFEKMVAETIIPIHLSEIVSETIHGPVITFDRLKLSDFDLDASIMMTTGDLDYDVTASLTIDGVDEHDAARNAFAAMERDDFRIEVWERGSGATGIKPAETFVRGEVLAEA